MNHTRTLAGDELVEEVSALVEGVFGRLKPVVAGAEAILNSDGPVQAAHLDGLRPQIAQALGGLVVGAGFIAAPDTLDDQRFGFEWWTGNGESEPVQVFISLDPNSERFLDYTRQSWFTVPRDSGRRHITGPYVDYLCTDTYTLTFTIPVRRNGKFAGVVGADVVVRELERTVQHKLRALRGRAALVNAQSRVIASNNARQATGSLVRNPDIPSWWASGATAMADAAMTLRRCGDSTIALLVTA
ncbi:cache domain-containing protein [Amycolatopsis sp.]|uniref:cache domain-containing protein n=1 Tax=Amycolatopsis sp. TaxID=37632 RepID=UPI002CB9F27C|nr:cache domain-containing protein [Amycolatopsis sp.]HVV10800.1 cache domain-containing protein [Amycolatopsis sp.]